MAKKETSNKMAKLASAVLLGKVNPTPAQSRSLAASVLGQDEHRGLRVESPQVRLANALRKKGGRL
jgi:hypothetical protein